jgi:hypothetical protein
MTDSHVQILTIEVRLSGWRGISRKKAWDSHFIAFICLCFNSFRLFAITIGGLKNVHATNLTIKQLFPDTPSLKLINVR